METSLSCKKLSIGYRTKGTIKEVCKNLNADLKAGALTILIGVNGAGKSTLLRTLSGFLKPLKGNVYIGKTTDENAYTDDTNGVTNDTDGITDDTKVLTGHKTVEMMSNAERAKTIGVVLTERTDIQQFTVREMVALGRSPYTGFFDRLSENDNDIIDESIRMVGIRELEHRMVDTLSDGERQKVMIAKVLAQQTPVILLDEPTAFLDYPSKVEVLSLLYSLAHNMNKSILLSTHDLGTALPISDEIWLMSNQGQLKTGSRKNFGLGIQITSDQMMALFDQ